METREIVLEDSKLKEWIEKKVEWVDKGIDLTEQITKLENERNKCGLQVQKYKDKIIPRTNELAKKHLKDEFDELERIELKDGKVSFYFFSKLEEWKERYLEQKNNQ